MIESPMCPVCGEHAGFSRLWGLERSQGVECRKCGKLLKLTRAGRAVAYGVAVMGVVAVVVLYLDYILQITSFGWLVLVPVLILAVEFLGIRLSRLITAEHGDGTRPDYGAQLDRLQAEAEVLAEQAADNPREQEWSCSRCGERNPESFDTCWSCSSARNAG